MATRVSEHTSVAQLASTSSSVLSSLANSLRDYELDKHDQEELHGENYLRFPVFGQNVLLLRRGLAKSQGQSIWKSGPIRRVSEYTIQEFTHEE